MSDTSSSLTLFQPQHVRETSERLLALAIAGKLAHVAVVPEKLETALATVLETARENYPDFQIPPYGFWRDVETGGIDRWGALANARGFETAEEMLEAAADLAILGVFMTTRHPDGWVFEDRMTGSEVTGRQASVLAAFHMFASGSFSAEMTDPYRVDAETLVQFDGKELAEGLQWHGEGDAALVAAMQRHLKRFGEALALRPDLFSDGDVTRPGLLAVRMARESDGKVDAVKLLDHLLETFAPVWDGGAAEGDLSYGDSFTHSGLPDGEGAEIVPFHLAAQDMVYALLEPFAWAGFEVAGLEALLPPADVVHAALFQECGALTILDAGAALAEPEARDRMIEIRAAASALTGRLADRLRAELKVPAEQLPLTCILEAGTVRAGALVLSRQGEKAKKLGQFVNPGSVFWLPFGA
ncbi:DUF1688 family protein [Roseibium sp. M-1]